MRKLWLAAALALLIAPPAFAQDDGASQAAEWQECVEENLEAAPANQADFTTLTEQAFASCQLDEDAYKGARPLATQESDRILMRAQIAAAVAAKFAVPGDDGISAVKGKE